MSQLMDLTRVLAEALVGRPELVRVYERQRGDETLLEVSVDEDDRGRIIGRRGATADALRTILAAAAERLGTRCRVEIVE